MLTEDVVQLLRAQHGVLSTAQLRRIVDPKTRRRILADPSLERLTPRVWRARGAPPTYEQRLVAAALDAGEDALVWGKTAARLWGFGRFQHHPTHVAIPRRSLEGPRLGQVHRVNPTLLGPPSTHRDVPVARPEHVVLWLAGMWTHRLGDHEHAARRTAPALDQAWRQGLVDGHYLHRLGERWSGKGHSGVVVLRSLLDERPAGYQPTGSALEHRFEQLVPASVLPHLRRQVTIGDDFAPIGIFDFRHDLLPLVIEVNGEAFHSSLTDRLRDEARYRPLISCGLTVVVYWEFDIWYQGWRVTETLAEICRRPLVPGVIRPTPSPWDHDLDHRLRPVS